MNTHINKRGQIVYENENGDIGIARPQEPFHQEKHGIVQDIKEGVQDVKEGIINLADKITGNDHHHSQSDH
uniref:Uncharacterized protein n=1 Tax=Panagrolaimus sp. ES5 TaxID=591445 RepID=A0AC34FT67_9BILA